MDSHDEMWNITKDHAHALPPHSDKKWKRYDLISDDFGQLVGVDFQSGVFTVKGNLIHTGDKNGQAYTFDKNGVQDYVVDDAHTLMKDLPYFPIYGRRQVFGDWGGATLYFCGWKRKFEGKEVVSIAYVFPNGQIVMT